MHSILPSLACDPSTSKLSSPSCFAWLCSMPCSILLSPSVLSFYPMHTTCLRRSASASSHLAELEIWRSEEKKPVRPSALQESQAFWIGNVLRATTACTFSTSQLPKVVRAWCALYILTWKCASRHNGVHFFDISTSRSGPSMVCFVHFDLEMCFAPQRRALFRHLNFQKWSEHGVFCAF